MTDEKSEIADDEIMFRQSIKTKNLIKVFMGMDVGDKIEWEKLVEIAGVPSKKDIYGPAGTARRHCEKEGVFIATLPGYGVGRVSPSQANKATAGRFDHVRRTAKKAENTLVAINPDDLSEVEKHYRIARIGIARFTQNVTKNTAIKKLEDKAVNTSGKLAISDEIIEMLKKS